MFSEATGARQSHVVLADVQPLGVLVEHRVDDVGEGFVRVKQAVAPGEQIALEPAEQRVLGQHLHDAAVARELAAVGVLRQHVRHPGLLAHLVDRLESIGGGLVRTEDAEARRVVAHHVAQELAERLGVFVQGRAARRNRHGVVAKVGELEVLAQHTAVGVRVRAHPTMARGRERLELRHELSVCVEQLFRPIATHPVFEHPEVRRIRPHVGERNLV